MVSAAISANFLLDKDNFSIMNLYSCIIEFTKLDAGQINRRMSAVSVVFLVKPVEKRKSGLFSVAVRDECL